MKNDGFWEAFLYKKKLSYLFIWKINNLSFLLKPSVSEKKKTYSLARRLSQSPVGRTVERIRSSMSSRFQSLLGSRTAHWTPEKSVNTVNFRWTVSPRSKSSPKLFMSLMFSGTSKRLAATFCDVPWRDGGAGTSITGPGARFSGRLFSLRKKNNDRHGISVLRMGDHMYKSQYWQDELRAQQ